MGESKGYILDTNILFLLYPYNRLSKKAQTNLDFYNKTFIKIIKQNKKVIIPTLVISEYINRYLRMDFYNKQNDKIEDFKKDYRDKDISNKPYKEALVNINDLLSLFGASMCSNSLTKQEFIKFSEEKKQDFNDFVIKTIAKNNKYTVITHDRDFINYKDEIQLISKFL